MTISQSTACRRFRASGLDDKTAYEILDTINHWLKSNGKPWTINRLKQLKVAYIHRMAGLKPNYDWIANRNGVPKGPFKRIFGLKKPQKSLAALMVYTEQVSDHLLPAQRKKFLNAVTNHSIAEKTPSELLQAGLVDGEQMYPLRLGDHGFDTAVTWANRKVRVPVVVWTGRETVAVQTEDNRLDSIYAYGDHPVFHAWIESCHSTSDDLDRIHVRGMFNPSLPEKFDIIGRIGFIQEPGLKLRSVANPFPLFQLAMSRLGRSVYRELGKIREDCTFDQDLGIREISEHLNKLDDGEEGLMSIDLSSATDRFPLSYQLGVLESMRGPNYRDFHEDVRLFTQVSTGKWTMPDSSTVTWKVGQPLGAYPSFGIFALSHHALARSVKPTFYRILGDDIVINRSAGVRMIARYKELGVPVSMDKTIDAPRLAEFASRIITPDRVYVQPKWKDVSDRSFVELVRNLGPSSKGLLKPRQRKVVDVLDHVLPEIFPLGLNWNTTGMSYEKRVALSEALAREQLTNATNLFDSVTLALDIHLKYSECSEEKRLRASHEVEDLRPQKEEKGLLERLGVSRADFADDLPPGWYPLREVRSGDPRGRTTLETMEVRIKSLLNEPEVIELPVPPSLTGPQ